MCSFICDIDLGFHPNGKYILTMLKMEIQESTDIS